MMMMDHGRYILDENDNPVKCDDLMTWGRWMENGNRRVALDEFKHDNVDIKVSTVFLGLDHSFTHGEPVLWETMIFGGKEDQYQDRYTSKADALRGHAWAIKLAKGEVTRNES